MKIAHFTSGVVRLLFVIVTPQPPLPAARPMVPRLFPVVTQKLTAPAVGGVVHAVVAVVLDRVGEVRLFGGHQVPKVRLHRGDVRLRLRVGELRIAMAAKMPMITTTISSSMSVKPLRFI